MIRLIIQSGGSGQCWEVPQDKWSEHRAAVESWPRSDQRKFLALVGRKVAGMIWGEWDAPEKIKGATILRPGWPTD